MNGKFLGGLTRIREIVESDKISHYFPTSEILIPMNEKLQKLICKGKFMLFLNGVPDYPVCAQSKKMMAVLQKYDVKLDFFDLTTDKEIGPSLVSYAKYSNFPQLYISGKLIGSVAIIEELDYTGQLSTEFGIIQ